MQTDIFFEKYIYLNIFKKNWNKIKVTLPKLFNVFVPSNKTQINTIDTVQQNFHRYSIQSLPQTISISTMNNILTKESRR